MSELPRHTRIHMAINREGALFIFFLTVLGGAAVYSGKNGLMLLFCCLAAALLILVMLARRNFQPLKIERRFVEDIYAGRDCRIDLLITNTGTVTVYGIHLYERFETGRTIGPMFVRRLDPGETAEARYMCRFPARGRALFCGCEMRSRFPVPFIEFRQFIPVTETACVYPAPAHGTDLIAFDRSEPGARRFRSVQSGSTIREIIGGRRTGRILWKLSARRGKWLEAVPVRRPNRADTTSVCVRKRGDMTDESFERQISQVAAYAVRRAASGRTGIVKLDGISYPYGFVPAQQRALLSALALYDLPFQSNS